MWAAGPDCTRGCWGNGVTRLSPLPPLSLRRPGEFPPLQAAASSGPSSSQLYASNRCREGTNHNCTRCKVQFLIHPFPLSTVLGTCAPRRAASIRTHNYSDGSAFIGRGRGNSAAFQKRDSSNRQLRSRARTTELWFHSPEFKAASSAICIRLMRIRAYRKWFFLEGGGLLFFFF